MNIYEHHSLFALELATFLEEKFTGKLGENGRWWQSHVVDQLSYGQKGQVRSRGIKHLKGLDFQALLRVFDRSWSELSHWCNLSNEARTLLKEVSDQRNHHAHQAVDEIDANLSDHYREIDTLLRSSVMLKFNNSFIKRLTNIRSNLLYELAKSELADFASTNENLANIDCCTNNSSKVRSENTARSVKASKLKPKTENNQLTLEGVPIRIFGKFKIYGPLESQQTEINSFSGNPVPSTEIPWVVKCPEGSELKIHICLIDDPDPRDEIGQVFCSSRLNSNQSWDQIVDRLRVGIRRVESGKLYMDLRLALKKDKGRPTRRVVSLKDMASFIDFDISYELNQLETCDIGTRALITGSTNRTKNWPCVAFDKDDIFTPVASWIATTIAPIIGKNK